VEDASFKMRETNKTPEFLAKFPLGKVTDSLGYSRSCKALTLEDPRS
jgi:hypothetical protein